MKLILAAAISRFPVSAGSVWNRIHRLIGLQRLGHEVVFVEELASDQGVDEQGRLVAYPASVQRRLFERILKPFGLLHRACQVYNHGEATAGMDFEDLVEWSAQTEVLLNMSGHLRTAPVLSHCHRRVYLDEDPVYTQLWHAEYGCDLNLSRHEVFFSVAQNIGTAATPIPDCGRVWHHFLPPVVLDLWPLTDGPPAGRFTTIAALGAYATLCYRGQSYGSKAPEFERLADLPGQAGQAMEVALTSTDLQTPTAQLLRQHQWFLSDAGAMTTLDDYPRFIRESRAEIGIAQQAYVHSRSGWFSDRSAHYLASGRPVLAASTGFEPTLPTGEGLLTFRDLDEAVAGAAAINAAYPAHCRAARAWAETHLDHRRVLPRMLELSLDGGV